MPQQSSPERAPTVWALPSGGTPDLQITVGRGNDTAGRQLVWTAHSPHDGVEVPKIPVSKELDGDGAGDWARRVMRGVEARKGAADLAAYLRGVQLVVGRQVPKEIWAALESAARAAGGHPTVLFATAEPYLPWELAKVPQRWDPGRPDLLGAQAAFGRWLYEDDGDVAAPAPSVEVADMAVVKGEYSGSARLPEAEAEADHLVDAYGATPVPAETSAVLACLRGNPEADVVHFAVHGKLDLAGVQDGIIMNDRSALDPLSILGVETGGPRLAFVNACQVGQGEQMLGDVAGVVPSLIRIGAQGVIAPLWKVDDIPLDSAGGRGDVRDLDEELGRVGVPGDGARALARVVTDRDMRPVLAVPLDELATLPGAGADRGLDEGPSIELTVDAPGEDEAQVVLEIDAAGVLSWHWAAADGATGDRAGLEQVFRIPVGRPTFLARTRVLQVTGRCLV